MARNWEREREVKSAIKRGINLAVTRIAFHHGDCDAARSVFKSSDQIAEEVFDELVRHYGIHQKPKARTKVAG